MTQNFMTRLSGLLFTFVIGFCLSEHLKAKEVVKPAGVYANGSATAVFIRGNRWHIRIGYPDTNRFLKIMTSYGNTDCANHIIDVAANLNIGNQRDTILHELYHAGTCDEGGETHNLYWNSDTAYGHEGIYKISQFTTSVLHDNPELARFLIGQ